VKNSKGSSKEVKKIWIFHHFFQWKMSEKQTTFFTINCAENLESPNQCYGENVVCFSDIFHWKKWWKIQIFFNSFELPFEFFTSDSQNSENVLSFSLPFLVKNVWKTNNVFHHKLCWKICSQPVTRTYFQNMSRIISPDLRNPTLYTFRVFLPSWDQ
jgi:hypothetical protein